MMIRGCTVSNSFRQPITFRKPANETLAERPIRWLISQNVSRAWDTYQATVTDPQPSANEQESRETEYAF